MSVEEITLAESLRVQSAKQFERLREANKAVNLPNIELHNLQKKMVESYHEFIQEKHNYEKTLEILANEIIKEREKLRKLKKEMLFLEKV